MSEIRIPKLIIGWREAIDLPDLGIRQIIAKSDTGARTSALHAFRMETFRDRGIDRIKFWVHPHQKNNLKTVMCVADVVDQRVVSDSGGHREKRYVVQTTIRIGIWEWPIECTLTNRGSMQYRMLLGRTAMKGHFMVDPDRSFLLGRTNSKARKKSL